MGVGRGHAVAHDGSNTKESVHWPRASDDSNGHKMLVSNSFEATWCRGFWKPPFLALAAPQVLSMSNTPLEEIEVLHYNARSAGTNALI